MLEVSINNLADAMNRLAYAIEGLNPQSAVAVTQAAVLKAAVLATETAVTAEPEPEVAAEPVDKKPTRKTKAKSEPVAEPAAVEPEPAAEPEPTAEPTPEPAKTAAVSAVSKDQLRVVFGQLSKAKGGNAVKAILSDFGFEGFSTVPDDAEEIEAMYRTAQEQLA